MSPEAEINLIPTPMLLPLERGTDFQVQSTEDNNESLDIDTPQQIEVTTEQQEIDASFKGWLKRHKLGAGLGIVAVGAAATVAPHMAETASAIGDNAAWAIPTLVATEAAWNSGAAMMLISAGKKVGNPLTLHSRIGELLSSVGKSKLFRTGLAVNIVGEVGTASVLTVGSIAELPPESWPLTIGGAAILMAPGVGLWAGIHRNNKAEKAAKQVANQ